MKYLFKNDLGAIILVTMVDEGGTAVDISTAATKVFRFQKPSGTTRIVNKTASFTTDGSDGKLQYVVEASVFDVTGVWELQPIITYGTGQTLHGEIQRFTVYDTLPAS